MMTMKKTYLTPLFEESLVRSESGFAASVDSAQPEAWTSGTHDWFENE